MNAQMSACDYYFKPVIISIKEYSASFFPLKKQALIPCILLFCPLASPKKYLKVHIALLPHTWLTFYFMPKSLQSFWNLEIFLTTIILITPKYVTWGILQAVAKSLGTRVF